LFCIFIAAKLFIMLLQYLSDNTGKHTAIVIPIAEWEAIVRKHADLKALEQPSATNPAVGRRRTLGEFAGAISSEQADSMLKRVEESREEWDRDI
jgi:hypothetical protein